MTDEQKQIVRQIIIDEFQELLASDRYIFHKTIQILDGRNIVVGTANGTKIGTETTQKLGFFGQTPVDKPETVSDPSGGATQDAEARTAIIAIISRLKELGIIK